MNGSPFDAARKKHWRTLGPTVAANLAAKGFEAVYADSREEALAEVLKLIPAGASVGVPGSVTIREIGAMDALSERGCSVIHHWDPSLSPESGQENTFTSKDHGAQSSGLFNTKIDRWFIGHNASGINP